MTATSTLLTLNRVCTKITIIMEIDKPGSIISRSAGNHAKRTVDMAQTAGVQGKTSQEAQDEYREKVAKRRGQAGTKQKEVHGKTPSSRVKEKEVIPGRMKPKKTKDVKRGPGGWPIDYDFNQPGHGKANSRVVRVDLSLPGHQEGQSSNRQDSPSRRSGR